MRIMIGSIAMVDEGGEPGITSPDYVVFRTRDGVLHHRWFYNWLRSKHGEDLIRSLARGAVRERLLFRRLAKGQIRIPSWHVQLAVVKQLRLTRAAAIAASEALEAAEQLQASYLRDLFGGPQARTWPTVRLGTVAEVSGGIQKSPQRAPVSLHYPFLTVRNVQQGYLDLSDIERFEVTPAEFKRLRLQQGDLLIVEANGSLSHIGRNALFSEVGEWIHQNHVIRVRLNGRFVPQFVSWYLNSSFGRAQMVEKAMTTSGLFTLSTSKVSALDIPAPPKPTQEAIVELTHRSISAAKGLCKASRERLETLESLSFSFLQRTETSQHQ
jgi:type I restriction enzyme S subunit